MNTTPRHSNYGVFEISRQIARRVQLEWEMVESPSSRPRFLDFPIVDTAPSTPAQPAPRLEKRPLAA